MYKHIYFLIYYCYNFQNVIDLKYFGININNANNTLLKLRISAVNKRYFGLEKLFKFKLIFMSWKSILYSSYLRPIIFNKYQIYVGKLCENNCIWTKDTT